MFSGLIIPASAWGIKLVLVPLLHHLKVAALYAVARIDATVLSPDSIRKRDGQAGAGISGWPDEILFHGRSRLRHERFGADL